MARRRWGICPCCGTEDFLILFENGEWACEKCVKIAVEEIEWQYGSGIGW
mgnify:CR=1 FL=1